MNDDMVSDSAARLFSANVDRAMRQRVEEGLWPASLWNMAVASGFGLALASEDAGGIGSSWSDAYPILRGIGYWQVPLPLAETMIASLLLSVAGVAVPAGPLTLIDDGRGLEIDASGTRISGSARRVAWARHCEAALVQLDDGRLALIDLQDRACTVVTESTGLAGEPSDDVSCDGASVQAVFENPFEQLAQPIRTFGAIARSAMMVGALESVLAQSVQYARERIQFGKAIGRNQAIQQQLALQAGDTVAARTAALIAAADAPDSQNFGRDETAFSAAVAKIRVGEAATRATSIAHQVHGAIGFTQEHTLHFGTRRLWQWREDFGTGAWWARRLGRDAIAAGPRLLWPSIVERRFPQSVDPGPARNDFRMT